MNKIVVIDDEEEIIQLLSIELRGAGYEPYAALDGESGIALVKEIRPDLIMLDIMMPGIDGYEVLKRFKADPETKDIPILMITAKSKDDDIQDALDLGAVDYVTKPFHPDLLIKRVETVLGQ